MTLEILDYQEWLNNALLPIAVIILSVLTVALVNRHKLRKLWQEWSTRRCLKWLGIKQELNVKFPDGLGSSFNIDRLVMLHDSILLISLKPFFGNIYCADNISEWTQVVDQKAFKFENPLFDLEYQVAAIRTHVPDVPIRGFLFFDHSAIFPKGHPEQVLHPTNIPACFFRANCPEPHDNVLKAWKVLVNLPNQA